MTTTLATIRSFMEAGDSLTAFHMQLSPQCTHSASLDWDYLADKFGLDFNIPVNHPAFMRRHPDFARHGFSLRSASSS
jgi:hypothetical protein